jgi:integrase
MLKKEIPIQLNYARTMIIKAKSNKKVGPDVVDTFRQVKPQLKEKHSNRRTRTLAPQEFQNLHDHAPAHLRDILIMGHWTGMRKGEILLSAWPKVDLRNRLIRLEASDTK